MTRTGNTNDVIARSAATKQSRAGVPGTARLLRDARNDMSRQINFPCQPNVTLSAAVEHRLALFHEGTGGFLEILAAFRMALHRVHAGFVTL